MAGGGHDGGGGLRWLITYADLITLLLAFFIILYASSNINGKKYQAVALAIRGAFGVPVTSLSQVNRAGTGGDKLLFAPDFIERVEAEVRRALEEGANSGGQAVAEAEGRVGLDRSPKGTVLRFADGVFFDRGKADLRPEALQVLDALAPALQELPNAIEVEGHTDSLPIRSGPFASNWELSAARATAVLRYLITRHGFPAERLAARGMGEFRPLAPNDPVKGSPDNRRVEIVILDRDSDGRPIGLGAIPGMPPPVRPSTAQAPAGTRPL
jgi:chemotaxis protein MotB